MTNQRPGDPIRGILHSTDANAGVAVPIFDLGSNTARTLAADEYIEVDGYEFVTVAGGDCYLLIGPDASLGTGETVFRGTFAANSGAIKSDVGVSGVAGATLFLIAPAGVVDVVINGRVMKFKTQLNRPTYQASLTPGL